MNRNILIAAVFVCHLVALTGCTIRFDTGEREKKQAIASQSEASDHRAAEAAADDVLRVIDRGEYGTAWDRAGPALKGSTNRMVFEATIGGVRKLLGKPISRTIKQSGFTEEMPDAPPGRYALVFYTTVFGKASYEEKIVLQMVEKERWMLAGYFLETEKTTSP